MAKIPIKTPKVIRSKLSEKATAAKTLSMEKARSITSTMATVAQNCPNNPIEFLYSQLDSLLGFSSGLSSSLVFFIFLINQSTEI